VTIYVYAFFLNFARTCVILLCPEIRTQQDQAGSGGIQKEAIASRHYNPNVEIVERWGD
jgi:hypothetical protein